MVPLFEKKEPPRLVVLRFTPQRSEAPGDRAAHWLLTISWSKFVAVSAGFYAVAATLFAVSFRFSGGFGLSPSAPILDALYLSLQALTVFGCGRLQPATPLAKGLGLAAIFVGWLALLLWLALTMVRFIRLRPFWRQTARIPLEEAGEGTAPDAEQAPN